MNLGEIQDSEQNLSFLPRLNTNLDEYLKLKFTSSIKFLEEQLASILVKPEIFSNLLESVLDDNFKKDKFLFELPSINVDLQVIPVSGSFNQFADIQEEKDSMGLEGNLIDLAFSNLISCLPLAPSQTLSFPVGNDRDSNLSMNSYLNTHSSSLLNLSASILEPYIFKSLNNFNPDSFLNLSVVSDNSKFKYKEDDVEGRINDVTYSNFESKIIKSILLDTGKFDTQVDMNDFIRKTCGFKSLFSKTEPSGTSSTLFDAVRFASSLKGSSTCLEGNDDAVSVVYDLFREGKENLPYLMSDHLKENLSEFLSAGMGLDASLKQRLEKAIGLDSNPNLGLGLDSSLTGSSPDAGDLKLDSLRLMCDVNKNDMHMFLEDVKELLSWARSIDLEKSIIEPLSTYFNNMESAINALTDAVIFQMQGDSSPNNMHDYKMGSEISRIP
ncbi:hypothetical protein baBA2_000949 (plasmid) [Borrelia anserina]|uniref:Uncharacterized protein n=2 Tax=Borrelia anserina TaxID=143 RepID=W5SVD1_BORAN|nr:hypothetical protein [Borrelia anserina]AHH08981.1 Hypothetical protein BAN_0021700 [Borrelia anserina BA2]APR65355.1 hypothetical protein N187_A36 [Borrelia anserina Es]UPA07319.1 hypothetical protein baBA2_000949 [Borrelia anserina]